MKGQLDDRRSARMKRLHDQLVGLVSTIAIACVLVGVLFLSVAFVGWAAKVLFSVFANPPA